MRVAVAVAVAVWLSLCWLRAAGHSLPRLRLSYRGEPGRGHLLRAGEGGLSPGGCPQGPPSWDRLGAWGASAASAAPKRGCVGAVGGQIVLGLGLGWVSVGAFHAGRRAPRGEGGGEEPGDGDRGCAAGLRASPAASHGGSSPTRRAGKLRHGGVLAPARFGSCAGWVLRCVGGPPAWWVLSILPSAAWGGPRAAPSEPRGAGVRVLGCRGPSGAAGAVLGFN